MPTCLITGANRGIGLEFARQYLADGWHVIATCRHPEKAEALRSLTGNIEIHALDVLEFARIDNFAKSFAPIGIDLLINNAGVYGPRIVTYDMIDYDSWLEVFRVNVMAPLKISAAFSRHVARSEKRLIASLSSTMVSIADNTSGSAYIYRTSKAALNAAMRSLAMGRKITATSMSVRARSHHKTPRELGCL